MRRPHGAPVNTPNAAGKGRPAAALADHDGATPHGGTCLTSGQVGALKKIYSGPVNSKGKRLYSNWFWDGGIWDPPTRGRTWMGGMERRPRPGAGCEHGGRI